MTTINYGRIIRQTIVSRYLLDEETLSKTVVVNGTEMTLTEMLDMMERAITTMDKSLGQDAVDAMITATVMSNPETENQILDQLAVLQRSMNG